MAYGIHMFRNVLRILNFRIKKIKNSFCWLCQGSKQLLFTRLHYYYHRRLRRTLQGSVILFSILEMSSYIVFILNLKNTKHKKHYKWNTKKRFKSKSVSNYNYSAKCFFLNAEGFSPVTFLKVLVK